MLHCRPHGALLLVALAVAAGVGGCQRLNIGVMGDVATCSGECQDVPVMLTGTKQPGERCVYGNECAPTCCPCPVGTGKLLLAGCQQGACMPPDAVCAVTEDVAGQCAYQYATRGSCAGNNDTDAGSVGAP